MLKELDQSSLKQWIEDSLASNSNTLAAGYQGKTLLYRDSELSLAIKIPHGRGLTKYLHTRMLHHEARVYRRLKHLQGIPDCYGLIDNRYLALEFIEGEPIRSKRPVNDEYYFKTLLSLIKQMHESGVAHMDLKRKDNLMVTHHDEPCILDFGTAVIRKPGLHPFNNFMYRLARRFDYSAWVKHKYHNDMHNIREEDRIYYRRTYTEKFAKIVRKIFKL